MLAEALQTSNLASILSFFNVFTIPEIIDLLFHNHQYLQPSVTAIHLKYIFMNNHLVLIASAKVSFILILSISHNYRQKSVPIMT